MKTKAAVLYEVNKPLVIEDLTIPALKSGQVLIKVSYSGLCHSQVNEICGLKGEDRFLPHTLGHEGSGTVEDVGPDVKKVKPGDKVILTWIKGCGIDSPSTVYKNSKGISVNSGPISTFLTRAVISENRLVKINDNIGFKEVALFGCAIPTGFGIVFKAAKIKNGSSVAIFGVGGIGTSVLLASKLVGAKQIIAVDVNDFKLQHSLTVGATHIINAKEGRATERIIDITGGLGVDYSIESAGRKESMEQAFTVVKDRGGFCIIAGNLPKGEKISVDPFDLIKGKKISGTWGGETNPDFDIPGYIKLLSSQHTVLSNFISHEFPLEGVNEAFSRLMCTDACRVMINLD